MYIIQVTQTTSFWRKNRLQYRIVSYMGALYQKRNKIKKDYDFRIFLIYFHFDCFFFSLGPDDREAWWGGLARVTVRQVMALVPIFELGLSILSGIPLPIHLKCLLTR